MRCMTRKKIEKLYLDYFYNYLTVKGFALNNNLSEKRANNIINIGRIINHNREGNGMKIKSEGNQVFNVPNNQEGKTFRELAKKFKQKGVQLTAKGRGKDRKAKGGDASYIPHNTADWFAVYVGDQSHWSHKSWINYRTNTEHHLRVQLNDMENEKNNQIHYLTDRCRKLEEQAKDDHWFNETHRLEHAQQNDATLIAGLEKQVEELQKANTGFAQNSDISRKVISEKSEHIKRLQADHLTLCKENDSIYAELDMLNANDERAKYDNQPIKMNCNCSTLKSIIKQLCEVI